MNISTTRFGTIEVSDQHLIVLPQGVIGFPALTRFAVIDSESGSVFRWWQAVDAPDVAFVVLDPWCVVPDYARRGLDADWADLGAEDSDLRQVAIVVTASGANLDSATFNLAAPILINTATNRGRQVVLPDERDTVAVRLDDIVPTKSPVELAA